MIKKTQPLTIAETRELLEKAEDRENFRAKKSLEYLKRFSKLKAEKAQELKKKLIGIEKLKEYHIVKIIDILPETPEELRSIFFGEDISLDTNETEKILQIIKEK